jgi:arylsulfatase A-like enzyme
MKYSYLALIMILGLGFCSCGTDEPKEITRPNVLMIVVDDMNGYGVLDQYPYVKTPYLDQFREQGINFINASCQSPVCSPSRASFFSGLYPHQTGSYLNAHGGWINESSPLSSIESFPECFRKNGYETWARGKIFHSPLDSTREYGMFENRPIYKGGFGPFPEEEYWTGGSRFRSIKPWEGPDSDFPDVKNAEAAIEFLKQEHERPFFLYFGLWRPHNPYTAPERFFQMYENEEFYPPPGFREDDLDDIPRLGRLLLDSLKNYKYTGGEYTPEKHLRFVKAYAANSSFTDWNVGRVIEALDSSRYAGNTLVIFFSDNGFHTGEKERWGKATLWEQADYVPLIIRDPQGAMGESSRTVSLVDLYPTLVEYCDLEDPDHDLAGKSMVPLLSDPDATWDRPSFTSYGEHYSSVRDERYRFIQYPDGQRELYDHQIDPYEFHNIANAPASSPIIERLSACIPEEWTPSVGGRLEVKR